MQTSTYEEIVALATTHASISRLKASAFITHLRDNGVPLDAIHTNDWENVNRISVSITRPYSHPAGFDVRIYRRFSAYDFDNAMKFWNETSVTQ